MKKKPTVIGVDLGMRSAGVFLLSEEEVKGGIYLLDPKAEHFRDIKKFSDDIATDRITRNYCTWSGKNSWCEFARIRDQVTFDAVITRFAASEYTYNLASCLVVEYPFALKGHAVHIYFRAGIIAGYLLSSYAIGRIKFASPLTIRKKVFGRGNIRKSEIPKATIEILRKEGYPTEIFTKAPKEVGKHIEHLYDACACALYGLELLRSC